MGGYQKYVHFCIKDEGEIIASVGVEDLRRLVTKTATRHHKHDSLARGKHIVGLMVSPDHRRKGIATKLMNYVCQSAQTSTDPEYQYIMLEVDVKNAGAKRLYEKMGFMSLYDDRDSSGTHHVMAKLLDPPADVERKVKRDAKTFYDF